MTSERSGAERERGQVQAIFDKLMELPSGSTQ